MFVYKHTETIEYVKSSLLFYGRITREFLGLRIWNFQGIILIWLRTNVEIFKSALVYL